MKTTNLRQKTISKSALRTMKQCIHARLKTIAQAANLYRDFDEPRGESAFVERVRLKAALREIEAALRP